MSGYDPKDTTCLNVENTDLLQSINQPIKGLKIGIVKEFNLGDLKAFKSPKLNSLTMPIFKPLIG